uniref:tRNA/rRNA methyltransferase SpoU type domain-containing protein n=1 Tax=viral metagenome TaxID=1070528 RepID=A0A6C0AC40_9ZZZZ
MAFRKAILNFDSQKKFFASNLETLNYKLKLANKQQIIYSYDTGEVIIPKIENPILELFLDVKNMDPYNSHHIRSIGAVIRSMSRMLISFAPYEIKLIIDLSHLNSPQHIFDFLDQVRWGSVSEFLLQDVYVITKFKLKSLCYTFIDSIKTKDFFDISNQVFKYQDLNFCENICLQLKELCLYFKWESTQQCAEISSLWFCIEGVYKNKINKVIVDKPMNKNLDIVCFIDKGQNQIRLIEILNKFCILFNINITLLIGSLRISTKGYRKLKQLLWNSCHKNIQAIAFTDTQEVIEFLKNRKDEDHEIYSIDLNKNAEYLEFGKEYFKKNTANTTLIFGGEKYGIPNEIDNESTKKLMIDTRNSINLVSCINIFLFEYFNS